MSSGNRGGGMVPCVLLSAVVCALVSSCAIARRTPVLPLPAEAPVRTREAGSSVRSASAASTELPAQSSQSATVLAPPTPGMGESGPASGQQMSPEFLVEHFGGVADIAEIVVEHSYPIRYASPSGLLQTPTADEAERGRALGSRVGGFVNGCRCGSV